MQESPLCGWKVFQNKIKSGYRFLYEAEACSFPYSRNLLPIRLFDRFCNLVSWHILCNRACFTVKGGRSVIVWNRGYHLFSFKDFVFWTTIFGYNKKKSLCEDNNIKF